MNKRIGKRSYPRERKASARLTQAARAVAKRDPELLPGADNQRYSIWVKDMDGNENHYTARLTASEAEHIERELRLVKQQNIVSEFVVVQAHDEDAQSLVAELNDWLRAWTDDASNLIELPEWKEQQAAQSDEDGIVEISAREYRRLVAITLRAQSVIDNWEHGDLAGAVRNLDAALAAQTVKPSRPRVVIVMDGGLVQEVLSSVQTDVAVIDYDTDGIDESEIELADIPQGDGTTADAWAFTQEPTVLPDRVDELFEAINGKEAERA